MGESGKSFLAIGADELKSQYKEFVDIGVENLREILDLLVACPDHGADHAKGKMTGADDGGAYAVVC